MLRLALRAYDWGYRWLYGLMDPAAAAGPIVRVRLRRHRRRPFALADGTLIRRGDMIGEIHFDNECVAAFHDEGRRSRWAGLAFRRAFHASLEALAQQVRTVSRYHDVRAFTALTIFHEGTQRVGFEIHPMRQRLAARIVAAYERRLLSQVHPLGKQRPGRARYQEARQIWISKGELVRRYAPEKSSASGTHR